MVKNDESIQAQIQQDLVQQGMRHQKEVEAQQRQMEQQQQQMQQQQQQAAQDRKSVV